MSILIKNGAVIDPAAGINAVMDVYITDTGAVGQVARGICADASQTIDAEGMWVVPGLIDLHTHLRDPGATHKETVATGAAAAVASGFTTICAMPNTNPAADSAETIEYVRNAAREAGLARVLPVGSITMGQAGAELVDFPRLKAAGACAFSEDGKSVMDGPLMERAFAEARKLGLPILSHCEDTALVKGGVMNDGPVSRQLGLPGISSLSEESIIERDIALCRKTGGALHVCHLSTRGGVELVRQARREGLNVTAEVCPHHFALTDEDILTADGKDTNMKMNPPLRSKSDVSAIMEGLRDGTISVIATDHAPHTGEDKAGGFLSAANGIIGLETAVPLCMDRLIRTGLLTPSELIEKMTVNPARVLGAGIGRLAVGAPADITVIDPGETVTVDARAFRSKSRNTPFTGWRLPGAVKATIVNGRIVYDNRYADR